jgi:hypothetical protein
MVNVFTTVVIALASSGLGFLVGWLFGRAPADKPVSDHEDMITVGRVNWKSPKRSYKLTTIYKD